MSFRDEFARVIANDPRYSIEAYAFILESLNQARSLKLKGLARDRSDDKSAKAAGKTTPAAAGTSDKPRGRRPRQRRRTL